MALLPSLTNITDVAHVIQLAVAPVFLLTGVGAILSVLVNRLGRVVDRFRDLDELVEEIEHRVKNSITDEMERLSKRAKMIHWSIGLCTTSALLVCIVIATMFVGSITGVEMPTLIASLFILAMLCLVIGLCCFLIEIKLAKSSIHVTPK